MYVVLPAQGQWACVDPEGGQGVQAAPEKSQKYRVS